jgi:hypothetical protein
MKSRPATVRCDERSGLAPARCHDRNRAASLEDFLVLEIEHIPIGKDPARHLKGAASLSTLTSTGFPMY